MEPRGGTVFKAAFIEAEKIVKDIKDKKEYMPIIILLTDGDDFHPKETIEYIKTNVSIFI